MIEIRCKDAKLKKGIVEANAAAKTFAEAMPESKRLNRHERRKAKAKRK